MKLRSGFETALTPSFQRAKRTRVIALYDPSMRDEVIQLISKGLMEFAHSPEQKAHAKAYDERTTVRDIDRLTRLARFNRKMWVATEGRQIIGCVGLKPTLYTSIDSKEKADVYNLRVHPSFRRQGIGSHLMDALERYAESEGIERLRLNTQTNLEPALALYKNRGYQISRTKDELVTMQKTLLEPELTQHVTSTLRP